MLLQLDHTSMQEQKSYLPLTLVRTYRDMVLNICYRHPMLAHPPQQANSNSNSDNEKQREKEQYVSWQK